MGWVGWKSLCEHRFAMLIIVREVMTCDVLPEALFYHLYYVNNFLHEANNAASVKLCCTGKFLFRIITAYVLDTSNFGVTVFSR